MGDHSFDAWPTLAPEDLCLIMSNKMTPNAVTTMLRTPMRHSRHSTLWVRPEVVAEIQFLECTGADHLRHTKFIRLRDDKDPSKVIKET